ncbi:unnamed protein product, partial [Ixodes persulcatus]
LQVPLYLQGALSAEQREVLKEIQYGSRRQSGAVAGVMTGTRAETAESSSGRGGGRGSGGGGAGAGAGAEGVGGGGGGAGGGGGGGSGGGGGGGGGGRGSGISREKKNDPIFREAVRSYVNLIIEDAAGIAQILMETSRRDTEGRATTL